LIRGLLFQPTTRRVYLSPLSLSLEERKTISGIRKVRPRLLVGRPRLAAAGGRGGGDSGYGRDGGGVSVGGSGASPPPPSRRRVDEKRGGKGDPKPTKGRGASEEEEEEDSIRPWGKRDSKEGGGKS